MWSVHLTNRGMAAIGEIPVEGTKDIDNEGCVPPIEKAQEM